MKLYLDISSTGNTALLAHDGVDDGTCAERWDAIQQANSKQNNDLSFLSYLSNLKVFARLLREYNIIKCDLLKLFTLLHGGGIVLQPDDEVVLDLAKRGYVIATANGKYAYAESINAALKKSESITTQLVMRRNKLLTNVKDQDSKGLVGIEEIIANLSVSLGFEVNDSITLRRFTEYKKIIRAKNDAAKARQPKGVR